VGKRRTRITIEIDEIVVARRFSSPLVAWCQSCGKETSMVTLNRAALLGHIDRSSIKERIESGQLHALESPETGLLICVASLNQWK